MATTEDSTACVTPGRKPRPYEPSERPVRGATEIYVSGREYKVPGNVVSYEQVVKIWNELHEPENKHIIGTPGIDYDDDLKGDDGILLPGKHVEVKDGTSFSVDPEHVS